MEDAKKTIVIEGLKATRPMIRLIECQMEKWMKRTQEGEINEADYEYKVEVGKESVHPTIYCALNVKVGSKRWRSHECGRTLQDALLRGLKHLQPYGVFAFSTSTQSSQVNKFLPISA